MGEGSVEIVGALAEDEAGEGRGVDGVEAAVGAGAFGGDGQRGGGDGEGARRVGDRVVAAGLATGGEGVGSDAAGGEGVGGDGERAGQVGGGLAEDEAVVARAEGGIGAAVGARGVVRGDGEGGGVHGQGARDETEAVALVGGARGDEGRVLARVGRGGGARAVGGGRAVERDRGGVAGAESADRVAGRCGLAVGFRQRVGGDAQDRLLAVDDPVATEIRKRIRQVVVVESVVEVVAARSGRGAVESGERVDIDQPTPVLIGCLHGAWSRLVAELGAGGDDDRVARSGSRHAGVRADADARLGEQGDLSGDDGSADIDCSGAGGVDSEGEIRPVA